ncbi:MAG TPA: galactonate dehydratase [Arenibacter sp.]|nr:galactonate dehydratase [Arenibacter sp.]
MKIIDIELFKVPPRWLFVKITTDDGLVGWGEPIVEGRADTVLAAVKELTSYIIGHDSNRIEDLWQMLYRGGFYRGGPILMSAISGIDQALWDIKGKRLGVPVYDLLGGAVRDRMLVYPWIGGDRPTSAAEEALKRKEEGYTAVKMNATGEMEWIDTHDQIDGVIERVAAIRSICGNNFGIGIDFHGRVHKSMAKILAKELEPFRPMFLEEPVLPENEEYLKTLSNHVSTPIATGERYYSRWDFKRIFQLGGVDIIQPDVSHAGGISEMKKIAAMAEAFDVGLAPHCPLGPIAFAASLQVDYTCVNAIIQETSMGMHYNGGIDMLDYLIDPTVFGFRDGYVHLVGRPGLGIEINEEKVREMAKVGHDWKNPIWRTASGVIAEW